MHAKLVLFVITALLPLSTGLQASFLVPRVIGQGTELIVSNVKGTLTNPIALPPTASTPEPSSLSF